MRVCQRSHHRSNVTILRESISTDWTTLPSLGKFSQTDMVRLNQKKFLQVHQHKMERGNDFFKLHQEQCCLDNARIVPFLICFGGIKNFLYQVNVSELSKLRIKINEANCYYFGINY